jgi:uncharacterized membrane protein YcaP (DUF421 family)
MYFESFERLLRVVMVGVPAYLVLVLFLRIAGKRTLSKMNAFDFVVTVALGSTLATILLSPETALAEGLLALAVLIALQFLITWTSVRVPGFQRLIKATPRLLAFRGDLLADAMRVERITEAELEAAVRQRGLPGVGAVHAVVLETDGTLTVIPHHPEESRYASLDRVEGVPEVAQPEP